MIGIFVALLSGALMSIQGVFNTEVTRQSSVWVSASWVQFSALITCLVIWGIFDRKNLMLITRVSPVYMLLGGVIGAFITYTVIQGMSALGPAKATMLIVIAQLTISWLIELCGMFGVEKADFSMRKLMGLLVAKWIWTGLFFGKGEGKFDEKMENDGIDLCAVRQPVWLRPVFLWNSAGKKGTAYVCLWGEECGNAGG